MEKSGKGVFIKLLLVLLIMISCEYPKQVNTVSFPKRLINEPYDLDKGWFFYDDSLFIRSVLKDVLNNLDPQFFNVSFITRTRLTAQTEKKVKKTPIELFAEIDNWNVHGLAEIGTENERIIQGVFLVEFEGPLKKYLNKKYVISFVRPPNMAEEKAFSIMIEHESPEAEKSWDDIKSTMCRNCN